MPKKARPTSKKSRDHKDKLLEDAPLDDPPKPSCSLAVYEPKQFQKIEALAELCKIELWLTCVCIVVIWAICAYHLYYVSRGLEVLITELMRNGTLKDDRTLGDGWAIIGFKQDISRMETEAWRTYVYSLMVNAGIHIVSSRVASLFGYQYRRFAWMSVGIWSLLYLFNWQIIAFCITMILTLFYAAMSGSTKFTWIVGLGWLSLFNYDDGWMHMLTDSPELTPKFLLFYICSAFFLLRIMSFSLEKVKSVNGTGELAPEITFTLYDVFVYGFYVPNLYTGPLFVYKYFQAEIIKPYTPWTSRELFYLTHKTLRCAFWWLFVEVFLHYIYIHLLAHYPKELYRINPWALGGTLLYYTAIYQAGHTGTYGLAGSVMRTDRIVPPSTPRCIVRVPYYSQHWRHFDPGLHGFFRNYVYIPLGGSRHGIMSQMFATSVTFMFVYYWHGARDYLAIWATINFLTISCELFASHVAQQPEFQQFEATYMSRAVARRLHAALNAPLWILSNYTIITFFTLFIIEMAHISDIIILYSIHQATYMSPAVARRLHAALNAPLWILSNYAIITFFTASESSWVYMKRLIINGSYTTWAVMLFLHYCMTIIGQEVGQWEKRGQGQLKVKGQ